MPFSAAPESRVVSFERCRSERHRQRVPAFAASSRFQPADLRTDHPSASNAGASPGGADTRPQEARLMVTSLLALLSLFLCGIIAVLLVRGRDGSRLGGRIDTMERGLDRVDRTVQEESRLGRREGAEALQRLGESLVQAQSALGAAQAQQLGGFVQQLAALRTGVEGRVDVLRDIVDQRLRQIQQDNTARSWSRCGRRSTRSCRHARGAARRIVPPGQRAARAGLQRSGRDAERSRPASAI